MACFTRWQWLSIWRLPSLCNCIFSCPFNILKHPAKYPHRLALLQEQKCCSKLFQWSGCFTHTHTHTHTHKYIYTHTHRVKERLHIFYGSGDAAGENKRERKKNWVHRDLNSQVLVWETRVLTFTPQSYPTDVDAVRVISPSCNFTQ